MASQNKIRIFESHYASLIESLQKMRMSSTNSKCVKFRFVAILIPSNNLLPFASRMALLKPSTTSKKSRADRGQPCLNPRSTWKKGEVSPLMRTVKEVVVMHAKIHFMKG